MDADVRQPLRRASVERGRRDRKIGHETAEGGLPVVGPQHGGGVDGARPGRRTVRTDHPPAEGALPKPTLSCGFERRQDGKAHPVTRSREACRER